MRPRHWLYAVARRSATGAYLTDFWYTINRYRRTFGLWPNLLQPKKFNEHINRKKLFDRNPILTTLADKFEVRAYVGERVGEKYLTQLYLVTDEPKEIEFGSLPASFVVKATHGSGWNFFVGDKSRVDQRTMVRAATNWLSRNYYLFGREWCYKNVWPRIIVEEYLRDANGEVPKDYKFFCFGGIPQFVQVDVDRFNRHRRNLYDVNWNRLDMRLGKYGNFEYALQAPSRLGEMLGVAQTLARGLDFVRVDLYNIDHRIYFGEMTHYHGNGFEKFDPVYFDHYFGSFWP